MIMIEVSSSAISAIGHDQTTDTAFVEFRSGKIYAYRDIDGAKFGQWLASESCGKYLNEYIKPFHKYYEATELFQQ